MKGGHILLCAVLLLWACILPVTAHTVIEAPSGTVAAGSNATFLLGIGDVTDLEGAAFTLTWDPDQFTVTAIAPADGNSVLQTSSMIRNDEGWAKVVVICPAGITVATDTCEPVLAVTITAGNETGTAPIGIAMAEYSTGFLPAVFDEAAEGVITIIAEGEPVPAPDAIFSATPTTGTTPLTVTFADQSTGTPATWSWDFGDGATATMQHPVHTYTAVGTYTVRLTVTGEGGSDTVTRNRYIIVTEAAEGPLDTDFTAPVVTGPAPLEVSFADTSAGSPTRWGWVFGDGGTANVKNPVHVYTRPGTYTVSLLAGDGVTSSRETKWEFIVVTAAAPPVPAPKASFSATPVAGTAPLAVRFTDTSTGASAWSWTFGDGTRSTVQHPVHTYGAAGTYTVRLDVTGAGGSDTVTRNGYIILTDASDGQLDTDFTASVVTGTTPLEVSFRDASTGSPDRWVWIFGDGSTANVENPVHIYTRPGIYTVSLLAGDGVTSSRETKREYIVVTEAVPDAPTLDASFSATPVTGTAPLTVRFTDTSTGSPDRRAWIFGDGVSSSLQNPVHIYTAPGTYTVTLMVGDGITNDRITREAYIRVDAPVTAGIPPVSRFWVGNPTPVVGENVQFIGIASDPDGTVMSWSWDFGDGILSNKRYLTHAFAAPGTCTVTLTVTDDDGLTDAASFDVTVRPDASPTTPTSYIRIS